jgi:hypothetical protein
MDKGVSRNGTSLSEDAQCGGPLGRAPLLTLAFSLAAAPQKESNMKFTYSHWNCSRRLHQARQQCVCIRLVGPFIGHVSK